MKKTILFLTLLCIFKLNAQTQVSNFTYNTVPSSTPSFFQIFNNKIFFPASNDGTGRELWASDGTPSGTNLIIDVANGETNGLVLYYSIILNNELYFVANNNYDYSGGEIWKTDGTTNGSSYITSFTGKIFGLTTVGNEIYMTIMTNDTTLQIWKTNGTSSATQLVKTISAYSPTFQGSINNKFIFTVKPLSSNNSRVWRSDGTDAGTYPMTTEIDGNGSGPGGTSALSQYIIYNNDLYFVSRYNLYKTNGTTANTITTVWNAQNNLVDFSDVIVLNGKMYLSFFSDDLKKLSIYKSDGTAIGTSEIYTATNTNYFYPSYLNSFGNNLIFSSINSNNGVSLFRLDSNTNLVTEITEIEQTTQATSFMLAPYSALSLDNLNGNLFFVSSPSTLPQKKGWLLDITSSSLTPLVALDNIYRAFGQQIVYNNDYYYSKNNQLWRLNTNNLSIRSFNDIEKIQFFPNPAYENIYFNNSDDISLIEIYDISGRLISKSDLKTSNNIYIGNLKSGNYIVKIHNSNGIITNEKFVKK